MSNDPILHLIGLAKKAGKLEVGEEPVGAACRARQAKLVLLAGDAAPNTFRRAAHFGEAGRVLWLEVPFTKSELGGCVGRTSCAMLAVMDVGFAAAITRKLQQRDPEKYGAASLQLEDKAARALKRQKEQRQHEKNLQQGKKKPWAPPPKETPRPPRRAEGTGGKRPPSKAGPSARPKPISSDKGSHPPAKPGRAMAPGRRVTVRGKLPPKK